VYAAECSGLLRSQDIPMGKDGRGSTRVTTTLSLRQKAQLDGIAKRGGVTAAWLVRRAVERLIEQAEGGPTLPLEFGSSNAER
jgi:hypothetical protein